MNSSQDSDDKSIEESPNPTNDQSVPETTPVDEKTPASTHPNRNAAPYLLFLLTLALIIASVGGTGFWLWTRFQHALTAQQLAINNLRQDLSDKASQQAVEDLAHQAQTIASQQQEESRLLQSLGQTIDKSQALIQRNRRGWSIAEVEYLMRIARYRLDLLKDTQGAESALLLANQQLADLGDMALLPVRQALTAEIQSLRNFRAPDKAGILLQIDQIMSQLVLPTPFGTTLLAKPAAQAEPLAKSQQDTGFRGFLEAIWQRISDHISIRHYPQQINDLSDITTQAHQAQTLYLNLQDARLAVLAGNNAAYHQSIQRVLDALTATHRDTARNQGLEQTLKQLDSINIAPTLPPIGKALTLLQTMNHASPPAPSPKGSPS